MGQVKLRELFENAPSMSVHFMNLTSETKVNADLTLASASAEGCVLLLPKATCSVGHQVLLTLFVDNKKPKKKKIEIVGKVVELNPLNEKECEVRIHFNQFLKEEWQYVLDIFELKQDQISEVIETLKTPKE